MKKIILTIMGDFASFKYDFHMFQALEGFLFVVSKEGNVEFVTDNVTTFLNYNKDEVLGKSIYNFIHHGDHTR